jgi:hypothetical protein
MSKRSTLDGRVIDYLPSDTAKAPVTDRRRPVIPPPIRPFVDGCAALLPNDIDPDRVRLGFCLFLIGAADRFWHRKGLDGARFPNVAAAILEQQGIDAAAATTLASVLPQVRETGRGRELILEGAELMDLWLDSRDANCLLQVTDLARAWTDRELPEIAGPD